MYTVTFITFYTSNTIEQRVLLENVYINMLRLFLYISYVCDNKVYKFWGHLEGGGGVLITLQSIINYNNMELRNEK